ncbi:MAG TPA: ADP-ribosylglycohydrolase family protein [Acidobacteriota bacterium]
MKVMRKTLAGALLSATIAFSVAAALKENRVPRTRRISLQELEDKIRGGWAGQMIGVSFGAPTEFKSNGRIIEGPLPPWTRESVKNSIHQDDLYVDMTLSETMDRIGLDATTEQYGQAFKDSKYSLWHANAGARRLLNRGVKAPDSGHPRYNIHADDIDFQIESDFIGLMTPGLPQESNRYCDRVGRVMNFGDGLYGGMFVCGMYSAAFFEKDLRKVVEQGLACMPSQSGYARVIRDVLDWRAKYPDDWKKTWQAVEEKWDRDDPCTDGALRPFNIDAKLNGAYIAIGLLYGQGDFTKTLEVTTRCGQDSDCNPSNAAGVLGVILGYSQIPEQWKSGILDIADVKFDYTSSSFNEITKSTLSRALQVIRKAGGSVAAGGVQIPYQAPKAPRLEQWSMGKPDKLVSAREEGWKWDENWREETGGRDKQTFVGFSASGPGSETTLSFSGTGVAVVGRMTQQGGRADVVLDGSRAGQIDAYIVERTNDNDLWHTFGLKPGNHTLLIVTLDEADLRSKGKKITIERAIVYR